MRRLLILTSLLATACLGLGLAQGKPDFSGTWTLNLNRSNFGKMLKPNGMKLTAKRDGDTMHAVQTTETPGGPESTESDWIADGKEHDTPGNGGKSLTKWEGNTLYSERRSGDGSYQEKIWLSLSNDGKTATEKVWTKSQNGTNLRTLVWDRI